MSVIFLGIPRDLTGITGADDFFKFDATSRDFCSRSARSVADLGFFLTVKCLVGDGCCPTYQHNFKNCYLHQTQKLTTETRAALFK